MSFSCTIKADKTDLTKYDKGPINSQLLGIAPNTDGATDAPYRLNDIRSLVANCTYGDRLPDAARDCFKEIQAMLRKNLESLKQETHCETCTCHMKDTVPNGWSVEEANTVLAIDPETITFIQGGW